MLVARDQQLFLPRHLARPRSSSTASATRCARATTAAALRKRTSDGFGGTSSFTWKEEVWLFNLGPTQFRRGNSSGPGYTMNSRYPWYRAIAEKGLLTLEHERDLSGGFTGWDDFFALTQAGVQRTATVVLTPEGAKIGSHQDAILLRRSTFTTRTGSTHRALG